MYKQYTDMDVTGWIMTLKRDTPDDELLLYLTVISISWSRGREETREWIRPTGLLDDRFDEYWDRLEDQRIVADGLPTTSIDTKTDAVLVALVAEGKLFYNANNGEFKVVE